jgi:hypothetical protein
VLRVFAEHLRRCTRGHRCPTGRGVRRAVGCHLGRRNSAMAIVASLDSRLIGRLLCST